MTTGFDPYEKQKETLGTFATFVWIGSGFYLYLTSDVVSILSWSALLFLAGGMFAAAFVFGGASYLLRRGLAKLFVRLLPGGPTPAKAAAIGSLGWVLMAAEVVIIFLAASWIFALLHPPRAEMAEMNAPPAFMNKSIALAREIGTAYQMGENCGTTFERITPIGVAGFFINYMSESEVQTVINEYVAAMRSVEGQSCDRSETAKRMILLFEETAAYIEEAQPFMKPLP